MCRSIYLPTAKVPFIHFSIYTCFPSSNSDKGFVLQLLTRHAGGAGFLVGGIAGVLRNSPAALFATASAIQCFALGSSFWATRGFVLQAWDTGNQTPNDRTKASAIAGAVSGGSTGLLFRGRSNAIPGAFGMAFFGFAGQAISNRWSAAKKPVESTEPKRGFWQSFIPMKHLTNEQYAEMLKERLLKVEVEISILDDKIAALRTEQQKTASTAKPDSKE